MTEFFAEFGLRDWLLIFGPVFIGGILIHGYWRMRSNRNTLKMSLDKSFFSDANDDTAEGDELTMLRAELPNGGARVMISEQTSLNLEEAVPVLMDAIDDEPEPVVHESVVHEPVVHEPVVHEPVVHEPVVHEDHSTNEAPTPAPQPAPIPKLPDHLPEKYMVINVMATGKPFKGQELLECLVSQEMSIGEMNIFHRIRQGQDIFSLMNAVEPGSFDLNEMPNIETPAVSMFMRVHELHKPTQVFKEMLAVAESLAKELGGEVRDETRSVMTSQTIEHCRQELEEYEFKNHT